MNDRPNADSTGSTEPSEAADTPSGYHRKRARTRRRLIDAGLVELSVHGPDGVTVAAISERAGMATGTFYNHFQDIESFVATVIDDLASASEVTNERLSRSGFGAGERVLVGCLMLLALPRHDLRAGTAFARLTAATPGMRAAARRTLRSNLVGAIEDGDIELDISAIDVCADAVMGAVATWLTAITYGEEPSDLPLDGYLRILLRLINATPQFTERVGPLLASGEVVGTAWRTDASALREALYGEPVDESESDSAECADSEAEMGTSHIEESG